MTYTNECKVCGYKKPKNGNRTIELVSMNITILDNHALKVIYSKWDIPMCNICLDDLVNSNEEVFRYENG